MKIKIAIALVLTLSGFFFNTSAQKPVVEKAKKLYQYFDYPSTIKLLEPITDKTPEILKMLAYSYYKTQQYEKAKEYFDKFYATNTMQPDDLMAYADVLMINEKYDKALDIIEKYHKLRPDDYRASLYLSDKKFYEKILSTDNYFMVRHLTMNTDADDFGPVFYKDSSIIFSSTRTYQKLIQRKWNWNRKPFLDFYIGDYDTITYQIKDIRPFSFKFNKKYHEGTATISADGKYIIFTSDNYKKPGKGKVYHLGLYESYFKNGHWTKPRPLPFNNPNYSVGHPSLSKDGKVLYFVSDMPGGIGGTDIYMAYRYGDSAWSKPVNLGKSINTEGNEMFPFIHPKGYLFFASDGHPGLGGLDIFVATMKNDSTFTKVTNLGYPINTNYDDFGLIFDNNMRYGYFSSNRKQGNGGDDLYAAIIGFPFFIRRLIAGHTYDQDSNILAGVQVIQYDQNNNPLDTVITGNDGYFQFNATPMAKYKITGTKSEYIPDNKVVSTDKPVQIVHVDLILKHYPWFKLLVIVKDDKTHEPIDGVIGEIFVKDKKLDYNFYTKKSYDTLNLDKIKLDEKIEFNISLSKKGYLTLRDTFSITFDHSGYYYLEKYLKQSYLHKLKKGEDLSKYLGVNNIYFDLNKWNIRPDAAKELDKVVKLLNDNPTLKLQLRAHTDYRGSDQYNLILSDKRAKSAAQYIASRINNPGRISGKGFGESQPLVVNEKIHNQYPFLPVGQKLTEQFIKSLPDKEKQEIANQLNRRLEIIVIDY